jgi:large subunit ribosomal protein L21
MTMYAIVKTGGKQYRVSEGQTLLIERLPVADGDTVELQPLLFVDGEDVVDGEDLSKVTVSARVLAHERGPKLRIVKFKPKRGYKRRTGHRQELTRIEVTSLGRKASRSRRTAAATSTPAPVAADTAATSAPAPVAADTAATSAPAPVAADTAATSAPAPMAADTAKGDSDGA